MKIWLISYFDSILDISEILSASESTIFFLFCNHFFFFLVFSRAAPTAYRGSQARGLIGAVADGLH